MSQQMPLDPIQSDPLVEAMEALSLRLCSKAEGILTAFLQKDPTPPRRVRALLLLALVRYERQEGDAAQSALRLGIVEYESVRPTVDDELRTILAKTYAALGILLSTEGSLGDAECALAKVFEPPCAPSVEVRALARNALAHVYFGTRRYPDAAKAWETALNELRTAGYGVYEALEGLADCLLEMRRFDEAWKRLIEALASHPPTTEAAALLVRLSNAANLTGRQELAQEYTREAEYFLRFVPSEFRDGVSLSIAEAAWNVDEMRVALTAAKVAADSSAETALRERAQGLVLNCLYGAGEFGECLAESESILASPRETAALTSLARKLAVFSAAHLARWDDVDRHVEEAKRDKSGEIDPELSSWIAESERGRWRKLLRSWIPSKPSSPKRDD